MNPLRVTRFALLLAFTAGLLVCACPASAQGLVWDAKIKEYTSKPGETNAHFFFSVDNTSDRNLIIMNIKPSCGCTMVKSPPMPWVLPPGANGEFSADVDLRGKTGVIAKSILLETSTGPQVLLTRVNIALDTFNGTETRARMNNLVMAQANRQAVFHGDCARCHVVPAVEKTGRSLYLAACGICHDAEHRATMVPDLRAIKHSTEREYWQNWIAHGKPGTLMPAFAESEGGTLTSGQIESLVSLLSKEMPKPIPARTPEK